MYILASDYDGTLNRGGISARDLEAVERFREAGNVFVIVSGRDGHMYEYECKGRIKLDYVLGMNGGIVTIADGDRAGEIVVCDMVKNNGCIRWIAEHIAKNYGEFLGCAIMLDRVTFHGGYPDGLIDGDGKVKYAPLAEADRIGEFSMLNSRCETEELTAKCVAEINEKWGTVVNATQNGVCIDIPPAGMDKGAGVARLASMLGVPDDNIWCVGDNYNDISMIKRFHGCCVENGVPALKAAAEGIYPSVADVIDHIMSL